MEHYREQYVRSSKNGNNWVSTHLWNKFPVMLSWLSSLCFCDAKIKLALFKNRCWLPQRRIRYCFISFAEERKGDNTFLTLRIKEFIGGKCCLISWTTQLTNFKLNSQINIAILTKYMQFKKTVDRTIKLFAETGSFCEK